MSGGVVHRVFKTGINKKSSSVSKDKVTEVSDLESNGLNQ